jgi:hypothetical protein
MTFKAAAAFTGALVVLPTLAMAQQPQRSAPLPAAPQPAPQQGAPQPDDPRVPHFAMAFEMQRVLKQCRIANAPVTAAQLDQKVSQLATAIGPAGAKEIRDEVSKEKLECPKAGEEVEGFKAMLTLVATKSSEEVAKAMEAEEQQQGAPPAGSAPPAGNASPARNAPPASQPPANQPRR